MKRFEHGGGIYGKDIRLDFSVNTNPLGIPASAADAARISRFEVYPDINYTRLRKVIAEYEGVDSDNIICSNGASEMIFALARAAMPKRAVLIAPSFSEYERSLLSVGCEVEYYRTCEADGFEVKGDFSDMVKNSDMTFVCNPNNPTGRTVDSDILMSLEGSEAVCVVDECFMDLSRGESMKGTLPVVKAFTKTYAMAGLRMGYMIADTALADKVRENLPAWNVSAPAQAAAIAAIEDKGYLEESLALIGTERDYLEGALASEGFKVFRSEANFILVKGKSGIADALEKRGILIRRCENFRGLDESYYRIAVKNHDENKILVEEIGDIVG